MENQNTTPDSTQSTNQVSKRSVQGQKSVLKIEGISKEYKGRKVVRSASFAIESGQVVGFLVPMVP